VWERESECGGERECERERVGVGESVWERKRVRKLYGRESVGERVCVCGRERESVWERESLCVGESQWGRER
jgi:hypothetical protein